MNKTIIEVYDSYLEFLRLSKKPTTVYKIQLKFKNYILPRLGKTKINELTKESYINFLIEIKNMGYNSSFFNEIQGIMLGLFEYLVIVYNVDNIIKSVNNVFKQKEERKTINNVWCKKEFKKFIRQVQDIIYNTLFTTLFFTGIRKGEALALQIQDYNYNLFGGTLTIKHTLTKELFNGKRMLLPPKNGKTRYVKVDFFTNLQLIRLIKFYKKKYTNFNNSFFIFGGPEPIACTSLERKKNYYCDLAKIKRIRIHDFRHSHATMLHKKHVKVKQIQERLGHSDISTTLNTYVHITENEEKRLIRKINLLRL